MAGSETPQTTEDVVLWVSDDKMAVYISGTIPEGDLSQLVEEIRDQLSELGIPPVFTEERLISLLRDAAKRENPIKQAALLKGVEPKPGIDGYIQWADDFFNPGFCVDEETGNIDYRKRAAQVEVEAEQLLATIIPPQEGKPGFNVFGEKLKPPPALRARINHRKNVRHDEENETYYARIPGRIRWENPQLEVDEVMVIKGNAGLATGDIDHRGAVVVEGDVDRGATIVADGDVEIRGVVEGANIFTKGSLTVHKGVFGGHESKIEVGGSVHTHFLNECALEAGREVVVEREVVNSDVKTRGEFLCPTGRVFGGRVTALAGIAIGQVGSEGFVRTDLTAGHDYKLREEIAPDEARAAELKPAIEKSAEKLKSIMGHRKRDQMSAQQRNALSQAVSQVNELRAEMDEIRGRIEHAKRWSQSQKKCEIEIRKVAYPEVTFHLDGHMNHLQDELLGPIRARILNDRIRLSET